MPPLQSISFTHSFYQLNKYDGIHSAFFIYSVLLSNCKSHNTFIASRHQKTYMVLNRFLRIASYLNFVLCPLYLLLLLVHTYQNCLCHPQKDLTSQTHLHLHYTSWNAHLIIGLYLIQDQLVVLMWLTLYIYSNNHYCK